MHPASLSSSSSDSSPEGSLAGSFTTNSGSRPRSRSSTDPGASSVVISSVAAASASCSASRIAASRGATRRSASARASSPPAPAATSSWLMDALDVRSQVHGAMMAPYSAIVNPDWHHGDAVLRFARDRRPSASASSVVFAAAADGGRRVRGWLPTIARGLRRWIWSRLTGCGSKARARAVAEDRLASTAGHRVRRFEVEREPVGDLRLVERREAYGAEPGRVRRRCRRVRSRPWLRQGSDGLAEEEARRRATASLFTSEPTRRRAQVVPIARVRGERSRDEKPIQRLRVSPWAPGDSNPEPAD